MHKPLRVAIGVAVMIASVAILTARLAPVAVGQAQHGEFTGDIKSVLYVSDVEASERFFREVLGFESLGLANLSSGEPYYAELAAGGRKFGLHEPLNEEQRGRVGQQRIYFRVRDLDAHRARIEARGVAVGDTVLTDWMDFFIVRDPDGHEIVFAVTDPARHGIDPW